MLYFWDPFLWRILILHPGHTNLFLQTVTIKFWGPKAEGREKQIPNCDVDFNIETTIKTITKRKHDVNNISKANNDSNNDNSYNANKEHVSNTNASRKEKYQYNDNHKEMEEKSMDQNTKDRKEKAKEVLCKILFKPPWKTKHIYNEGWYGDKVKWLSSNWKK